MSTGGSRALLAACATAAPALHLRTRFPYKTNDKLSFFAFQTAKNLIKPMKNQLFCSPDAQKRYKTDEKSTLALPAVTLALLAATLALLAAILALLAANLFGLVWSWSWSGLVLVWSWFGPGLVRV